MCNVRLVSILIIKKIFSSVIVLGLLWGGVASAEVKKWNVSKSKDGTIVFVEINGEVTYGDSLTFWLKKKDGKCDILQETFTFYSMHKNPNFKNLLGKLIPINIKGLTYNNGKVYAEVSYTAPFMSGNRAFFSMGLYEIEEHIKHLSQFKTYDLTIVNDLNLEGKEHPKIIKNFKASDYFDIPNNRWNLKGVKEALIQGQKLCME